MLNRIEGSQRQEVHCAHTLQVGAGVSSIAIMVYCMLIARFVKTSDSQLGVHGPLGVYGVLLKGSTNPAEEIHVLLLEFVACAHASFLRYFLRDFLQRRYFLLSRQF